MEAKKLLETGEISSKDLILACKKNAEKYKDLNMILTDRYDEALKDAGPKSIPGALKDVFFLKGTKTTAGSKILKDFNSPFDADLTVRLRDNCDSVFVAKTCTDEFTMGSFGKTNFTGPTKSPWKNNNGEHFSPGGSSSGSSAILAAGGCLYSTGTDTGGSIREPAAWTGLVGGKFSYGAMPRYGIISLVVNFDSPGYFTYTVEDLEYLFNKTVGISNHDYTTIDYKPAPHTKKKIALIKEFSPSHEVQIAIDETKKVLEDAGYEFIEVSIPLIAITIELYYVFVCSSAASELSKFDGIFYGDRSKEYVGNEEIYNKCRTECFGPEVKRRILIGNYLMYSANVDDYYWHALRIQQLLWESFEKVFQDVDCILCPTAELPMTVEETLSNPDPVKEYKCDLYTTFVNLMGFCGINVPIKLAGCGSPVGIQLVSKPQGEHILFHIGKIVDKHFDFCRRILWKKI